WSHTALRSSVLLDPLPLSRAVRSTVPLAPTQAVDVEHDAYHATASGTWRGGKSQCYSWHDY
ncbi:MAG TPA: hypothetical protein VF762_05530, partial [Blastocatellia bacterium]